MTMIQVTQIGDLAFEVRFDPAIRQDLRDVSGWGTEADAINRILADVILGPEPYEWDGEPTAGADI
ncbi:hypothetical protein WG908_16210 [Sphingobium sp. AN641]|uniref:hypothetical protein n=1 Tax=Sphingobium sp. AN641 TaxID=3133443 RepID=UPI0030BD5CE4